jgi:prepilin-type N-terminal cleavage/methylation domain-containing protein
VSEDDLRELQRRALLNSITRHRSQRGFSMIEMLVGVAIALTVAGMAVVFLTPTMQEFRANSAASQVVDILRQAREYAITYRRYVQVTFPNYKAAGSSNQIQVVIKNSLTPQGGNDVTMSMVTLQGNVTFQLEKGMPDTPDAFGDATPVNVGSVDGGPPAGMFFQADGTFVNSTGGYLNGSIFMGTNSIVQTARAVTILGTTGRVREYHVTGNAAGWFETR